MAHHASGRFWAAYRMLPEDVRTRARRQFRLLKRDAKHPSIKLKKIGALWSVRVTDDFRALAIEVDDGLLWVWIGPHDEYERLIKRR